MNARGIVYIIMLAVGVLLTSCGGHSDNVTPVANSGSAQTVTVASVVALDGSASSNPDGDTLTYMWTLISAPAGSTAVLTSPTSVTPTFTPDFPGIYVVQLIVTDGTHTSEVSTVTVTVGAVSNVAPVANAGSNQSVTAGTAVTLNGSSSADADGDTITYAWTLTTVPTGSTASLTGATTVNPTFTPDVAGTYVAQLIVSDATHASAAATATITAAAPAVNHVPVANAGSTQHVTIPVVVTLDGSVSSDPDGDTITYAWTMTSIPTGSTAVLTGATSASPTFTPDIPGNYVAQLIVSDGSLSSVASTVTVGASGTLSLLTNGSFESGLTGWTTATQLVSGAAGTCGYNGVTAPGTETLTSLPGFAATAGTETALGSVTSTSGAGSLIISCVLYQDVAIPAGATTATFTYDIGAKGGADGGANTAARVGIYPTTAVPGFGSPTSVGTATLYAPAVADTTLHSQTSAVNFNIASRAGTTVRFAIINGAQNSGHEVIGIDNVKLQVLVSY